MQTISSRFLPHARRLLQVSLGIAWLIAVDHLAGRVLDSAGIQFPSFVLGMVGLFAALSSARTFWSEGIDRFTRWCAPAAGFLGRWMALFFVPPLVLVPLQDAPSARDLLLLLVIGGGGFVGTFAVAGWLAGRAGPTASEPVSSSPGRAGKSSVTQVPLVALLVATWISGIVANCTRDPRAALVFGVVLSVLAFSGAEIARDFLLFRGWRVVGAFFHPVLLGAAGIAVVWRIAGLPLDQYLRPGHFLQSPGGLLMFFLRPAVVALALALDAQRLLLRMHAGVLLLATAGSAAFSLFATAFCAGALGLSSDYARAIVSRSVTTPVALAMAQLLGAPGGVTAMIVILTGVLGALFAQPLGRFFGFDTPFVLGIATGASSHGIGTAGLVRHSPAAAAFSGVAFALMAVFSALLVSSSFVRELLIGLL